MISAGQTPTTGNTSQVDRLAAEIKRTVDFLCNIGSQNAACENTVKTSLEKEAAGTGTESRRPLREGVEQSRYFDGMAIARTHIYTQCGRITGIDLTQNQTPANLNRFAECARSFISLPSDVPATPTPPVDPNRRYDTTVEADRTYINSNRLFPLHGTAFRWQNFVDTAGEVARGMLMPDPETINMPPDLQALVDKARSNPATAFLGDEAERLFRQGMGQVPRTRREGNKTVPVDTLEAADRVGDGVAAHVFGKKNDDGTRDNTGVNSQYQNAPNPAGKAKVKYRLIYTVPEKVGEEPAYISFRSPSDAFFDPQNGLGSLLAEFPPEAHKELSRLYFEAMGSFSQNGGDPQDDSTVVPALRTALEALSEGDPAKIPSILPNYYVDDVPVDANKQATAVVLKKRTGPSANLVEGMGLVMTTARRNVINRLWREAVEKLPPETVLTTELRAAMEASMIQQRGGKRTQELAQSSIYGTDANGAITFNMAPPAELYRMPPNIPMTLSDADHGWVPVIEKYTILFQQALAVAHGLGANVNDPTYRKALAEKINQRGHKILAESGARPDNAPENIPGAWRFLHPNTRFTGFANNDPNGDINIEVGSGLGGGAGVGPVGPVISTGLGDLYTTVAGVHGYVGSLNGSPNGWMIPAIAVGLNGKAGRLEFQLAGLGYSAPPGCSGYANENMDLTDGGCSNEASSDARIRRMNITGSRDFGIGRFSLSLGWIGGKPKDFSGHAIDSDRLITGGLYTMNARSSDVFGLGVSLPMHFSGYKDGEHSGTRINPVVEGSISSAKTHFAAHDTVMSAGSGYGLSFGLNLDLSRMLIPFLQIDAGVGFDKASDYTVKDKLHPSASASVLSTSLAAGSDSVHGVLGARYASQDKEGIARNELSWAVGADVILSEYFNVYGRYSHHKISRADDVVVSSPVGGSGMINDYTEGNVAVPNAWPFGTSSSTLAAGVQICVDGGACKASFMPGAGYTWTSPVMDQSQPSQGSPFVGVTFGFGNNIDKYFKEQGGF